MRVLTTLNLIDCLGVGERNLSATVHPLRQLLMNCELCGGRRQEQRGRNLGDTFVDFSWEGKSDATIDAGLLCGCDQSYLFQYWRTRRAPDKVRLLLLGDENRLKNSSRLFLRRLLLFHPEAELNSVSQTQPGVHICM